jgi:hypothetical protein
VNNGRLAVNYERRNPGMFCDTRATLHDGSIVLSFQGNRDQIVTLATLTRPLTADGISCTKAYFESETGFNVLEFART